MSGAGTGLAIEMQSADGRATPEQSGWLNSVTVNGWYTNVCRNADEEARAAVQHYLDAELPPL